MILCFSMTGCLLRPNQKPNYILIGIDRFAASSLSCAEYLDKAEGGLYRLCSDFIRFTNAYTPSIQSAASVASVLTGLYPIEHGVRHSDHHLSATHNTLALNLFQNGYDTAFFSGGDPIPSYIGLQKGFQSFYDFSSNEESEPKHIDNIFKNFLDWFKQNKGPSFSFIYVPTLRYSDSKELNFIDIERNLTQLFTYLKSNKRWHNTNIVVFGLQGLLRQQSINLWPVIDLSEENIKVELFFKPAGKLRDKDISFQVDQNVSLVDLGQTLFDLAGHQPPQGGTSEFFNKAAFTNVLMRKVAPKVKRTLLVESGWPDWRYGYSPVYLIVEDQYRVEMNKELRIYNTLLGRSVKGLPDGQIPEGRWLSFIKSSAWLDSNGRSQFKDYELEKLNLGVRLWGSKNYSYPEAKNYLNFLYKNEEKEELLGWMAQLAVRHKDCDWLEDIGKQAKNLRWRLAAKSCLRKRTKLHRGFQNQCEGLFNLRTTSWPKDCQSDLIYYTWRYINNDNTTPGLESELSSILKQRAMKQRLQQNNWKTYLSSAKMYETSIRPDDFDLYVLQLKKEQKIKLSELLKTLELELEIGLL